MTLTEKTEKLFPNQPIIYVAYDNLQHDRDWFAYVIKESLSDNEKLDYNTLSASIKDEIIKQEFQILKRELNEFYFRKQKYKKVYEYYQHVPNWIKSIIEYFY